MCKQLFMVLILLPTNFCDGIPLKWLLAGVYNRAGGKGTAGTAMAVPVFEGEKMASLAF